MEAEVGDESTLYIQVHKHGMDGTKEDDERFVVRDDSTITMKLQTTACT